MISSTYSAALAVALGLCGCARPAELRTALAEEPALFEAVLRDFVHPKYGPVVAARALATTGITDQSLVEAASHRLVDIRAETLAAYRDAAPEPGDARRLYGEHEGVTWLPNGHNCASDEARELRTWCLIVSRAGWSTDRRQAAMWLFQLCDGGAMCGEGGLVLLQRDADGGWRVVDRAVFVHF